MNYKIVFLFISYLLITSVHSQNFYFKNFNSNNGLSNNSVKDIANDKNGGLWIATWDGLNFYDGNRFKIFKHLNNDSTSIANNEIFTVINDKNNNIWIETNVSISKYIGDKRFKNFYFEKKIKTLQLSKDKNPIVSFVDSTFLEYKNGKFITVSKNRILKKNNTLFKEILLSKYPNLVINDVYKSDDETVWFATKSKGVYILTINKGKINITNFRKKLYNPLGIPSNEVETIHKDIFGGIWLGSKDGGLSLAQESVKGVTTILPHPVHFPHLPTETIRAITKDFNNNLWIGYYTKGLFYFNKKTKCFLPFKIKKAKKNTNWNKIRSLYTSSNGTVWVGTYAGIIKISEESTQYIEAEKEPLFPNNRNYNFFEDKKSNTLWITCWGGIAKINLKTNQFESFKGQSLLANFRVRNIYAAKKELLIATVDKGVVIFNKKLGTYTTIGENEGLAGNSVFSILYENNRFWVACLGGISILDINKKVITTLREKDGLPSHMVYGLLQNSSHVWISTTKGIAKINKKTFLIHSLNPDGNWQAKEFSEGAYYKDNKDTFYFGGINGLSYFNANGLKTQSYLPKIKILIDEKTPQKEIEKSFSDNTIKVSITPISFIKNKNNKVLYKLDGYDKNWNVLNKKDLFYKNIPSGKYTLLVKNSLSTSEDEISKFSVLIKTPFYLSIWFLTLLSTLILLSVIFYLHKKNKESKTYQEKLKKEIKERTTTIENQKHELLKLYNNLKSNEFEISKFKSFVIEKFKQPLTVINENISSAAIIEPNKKEIVVKEVKKLMDKVLEWDYLGEIASIGEFKKTLIEAEVIKNIIASYKNNFTAFNHNFHLSFKSKVDYMEIDLVRCKLLFQYLFNDFLKYPQSDADLFIDIHLSNNNINFKLTSNNKLLLKNIRFIQKYSPYYKAFLTLLEDLRGDISISVSDLLCVTINIPLESSSEIKKTTDFKGSVKLGNINFPQDKTSFLIYGNKQDFNVASCLLESPKHHLVFESNINSVQKLLYRTKQFTVLILYNVSFNRELINLLDVIYKNNTLLTVYISEKISYSLQEKIAELHINEIVQLPISKNFLANKIKKLLNNHSDKTSSNTVTSEIKSPNEKLVEKAIKIIDENYGKQEFNIDFLVTELGISRIKCYRIFKEVLKQSPSDIIIRKKMEKALELIKLNKLNVSEISYECGFSDPKYFGKAFKKFYGISPKKFKPQ